MADAMFRPPDVLVLGGGGILGEAWMNAVLAGIEDAAGFDARGCESYVGTSAGSIVAAGLAAGMRPDTRLGKLPEQPPAEQANGHAPGFADRAVRAGLSAATAAAAPVASLALSSVAPGGALVRRIALGRMPQGRRSLGGLGQRIDSLGARFDGRLAVSTVELESGRRVMFGQDGAPRARVGEAVEASCAIPGFFHPIEIGGRTYVDGGAWSPTNMDTAQASRGTAVLCLNPTGSMGDSVASPLGAIGLWSRSMAGIESLVLERRGARVTTIAPDSGSVAAIGRNLMDPRPRQRVIAAGVAQGRRIGSGAGG
jgi:NTE family protein